MQTFNEANLKAGLATFILPSMAKREEAALKLYNREVSEGIPHRLAIEHALKAAAMTGKPLKDAAKKLRLARRAAGITATARAQRAAKPIATTAKALRAKVPAKKVKVVQTKTTTRKHWSFSKAALTVSVVLGGLIGLLVAIYWLIPLGIALNESVYGGGIATFVAVLIAPLSTVAGAAVGWFIITLIRRKHGYVVEKEAYEDAEILVVSKSSRTAQPATTH